MFASKELPLVSIIIVSYNSVNHLVDCLSSITSIDYSFQRGFETILVDNASTDKSITLVKEKFPWVKVIATGVNAGYGVGCNVGANAAAGDFLMFLNPDTKVSKNWLTEQLNLMLANSQVGACGGTVLFWGGKKTQSLGGLYNQETGYSIDLGFGKNFTTQVIHVGRPFFHCCGVSLLVRAEVFKQVGGFADDYFMYFDEVDLCWRIRLLGYQIYSVPLSIVYHKIDSIRAHSSEYRFFIERNSLQTLIKSYEFKNLIKYGPLVVVLRVCGCLFLVVKGKKHHSLAILNGISYVVRNFKKIWRKRQAVQKNRIVTDKTIFNKQYTVSLPALLHMFSTDVLPFLD